MSPIKVTTFKTLPSTNTYLKNKISEITDWQCVRAVNQDAGRGRFSRSWNAVSGKDLTFSVYIPTEELSNELLPNLAQITAVAISSVIEDLGETPTIKWPNDILLDGKKVCGILLESVSCGSSIKVIAGIGLNVNSNEREVDGRVITSLSTRFCREFNLDELLSMILTKLYLFIENLRIEGLTGFINYLNTHLAYIDEIKTVTVGEEMKTGEIIGVSSTGALCFKEFGKESVELISGEISFRSNSKDI